MSAGTCPWCQAELLASDLFCRACGRDVVWTHRDRRRPRRIPRALRLEDFQDQTDRTATRALGLAAPVRFAVDQYLRRVSDPELQVQLLGSSVRASETQFPRVLRLVRYCERVLHLPPAEVFVTNSPEVKARTFSAASEAYLVVTTGAEGLLDDDELLFVVGRQLGHVKARHVLFMTVAKALSTALRGLPGLGSPLASAANYLLVPWERRANLTADRAGLICCQDLSIAARALLKLYGGSSRTAQVVNVAEFVAQAQRLPDTADWGDAWSNTPALLRRLLLLERFYRAETWDRIFEGAWDPGAPRFACYFCPGGGTPPDAAAPLSALRCDACERDLLIEEVLCPWCCAAVPVEANQGLADLTCSNCERTYLAAGDAGRVGGTSPSSLAGFDHYQTLGVHPTARPAELRRAFRSRIAPLDDAVAMPGQPLPAGEKIRLYAAYKNLIEPGRRARHDQHLVHGAELLAWADAQGLGPRRLARCRSCSGPILEGAEAASPRCGGCGAPVAREDGDEGRLTSRLSAAIHELGRREDLEVQEEVGAGFDLALHGTRASVFTSRLDELCRPGPIRRLAEAAEDLERLSRGSPRRTYLAVVDGELDLELVARILGRAHRPGPPLSILTSDGSSRLHEAVVHGDEVRDARPASIEAWLVQALGLEEADQAG